MADEAQAPAAEGAPPADAVPAAEGEAPPPAEDGEAAPPAEPAEPIKHSYTLFYFNVKALAEPLRYLFAYGGIEYEDVRVTRDEWPALKPSKSIRLSLESNLIESHVSLTSHAHGPDASAGGGRKASAPKHLDGPLLGQDCGSVRHHALGGFAD